MATLSSNSNLHRRRFLGALFAPSLASAAGWGGEFIGGRGASLPDDSTIPHEWSDDRNLAWRTPLPGYGQSSPVVSAGIALITGVEGSHKDNLLLAALDMVTGKLLWTYRSAPSQRIEDSDMVSRAAPTPVATQHGVIALFETGNLVAIDREGRLVWERSLVDEFGEFRGRHGIGSSLRSCQSGVLALVAHDGPSYLICLNPVDGRTVWKAERPKGVAWTTPTVVEHSGREVALISAGSVVEGYDAADGSPLWTLEGLEGAFVASPSALPGGAVIGSSSKGHNLALRFGSSTQEVPEIAWRSDAASSYFSSPLVHRGRVYMVNKAGVAFCLDAGSGREIWHGRLEGQCWASPISVQDRIYFFGVDGTTEVVAERDEIVRVARNRLSVEGRLYGVGVADRGLLLRYGRELALVSST